MNEKENKPCIYKATSRTTGKSYIGQSVGGFEKRYKNHAKRYLKWKSGPNKFYPAIQELGWEDFTWEILFIIEDQTLSDQEIRMILNEKEVHYINQYNSIEDGYNFRIGGGNSSRIDYAGLTLEEKRAKQQEIYKERKLARHLANREARRAKAKIKRDLNKDEINRRKRERHKNNDARRERKRQCRREYLKQYRAANRKELNEKQRIRKANKKMEGGDANHEVYDN